MINAHELRIGNWVSRVSDKQPFKVRDGEDIDDLGSTNSYEPIPLTPEILEKAGFEEVRATRWVGIGSRYFRNKQTPEFVLDFRDDKYFFQWHIFFRDDFTKCTVFDKVHELQNLFFFLTGSELEITQPA